MHRCLCTWMEGCFRSAVYIWIFFPFPDLLLPVHFSDDRHLSHFQGRGGSGGSKKNSCFYCGKSFAVRASLEAHVAGVHYKAKMYKCDRCGMAFTYKTNVYRHRKVCKGSNSNSQFSASNWSLKPNFTFYCTIGTFSSFGCLKCTWSSTGN